jgi:hypothetical protein
MVWLSICLCNEVDKVVDFVFVQRVLVVIQGQEEWEEREMLARGKKPPRLL